MVRHVWDNIAGKFHLVAETESAKIVGLIGNVWYHDLSQPQKDYIAGFFMLPGHSVSRIADWPVAINGSMYNEFMAISK